MESERKNKLGLDLLEYSSSLLVIGLLFLSANAYYHNGPEQNVLGASDSVMAATNQLPSWVAVLLAGFIFMGVVVLITVILSAATVKKMKRG